jgi:AAA+ superfamily predicted ATPase
VFLKHLEYFSGIVFLTSNRVDVFDEAMKSRIHLALEYAPPLIEMRRTIWTQCLNSIPQPELGLDIPSSIDTLVKDNMNGREITNAVNTARTLARHNKEKLQLHHVDMVLQVRRDFDASLVRLKKLKEKESHHDIPQSLTRQNSLLASIHETEGTGQLD